MKLSELVYYRNTLDSIDTAGLQARSLRELDHVRYLVLETGPGIGEYTNLIQQRYEQAAHSLNALSQVIIDLRAAIDAKIQDLEQEYFAASTRLYNEDMCWETTDYVLNRRLFIDDDSNILLRSRLRNLTDWRIPGMIIRPGREDFIEHLVPLDPLYLVDTDTALLEPSLSQFNDTYRARLRAYVVKEQQAQILHDLPQGQFGLVFAYNFFNYKPWELVQQWLQEIFYCLRPGGTVLFTFNNCDLGHGVALTERNFMTYVPQTKLIRWAEQIGYDLVQQHRGQADLCWLELQRPGQITTLRGSQALAKIMRH